MTTDELGPLLRDAADDRAAPLVLPPPADVLDRGRRRRRRRQVVPVLAGCLLLGVVAVAGVRLAGDGQDSLLAPGAADSAEGVAEPIDGEVYGTTAPERLSVSVVIGGGCYRTSGVARVEVEESADRVVLRATVVGRSARLAGVCPAVAQLQQVVVALASPLAARPVVDGVSGRSLTPQTPAPSAEVVALEWAWAVSPADRLTTTASVPGSFFLAPPTSDDLTRLSAVEAVAAAEAAPGMAQALQVAITTPVAKLVRYSFARPGARDLPQGADPTERLRWAVLLTDVPGPGGSGARSQPAGGPSVTNMPAGPADVVTFVDPQTGEVGSTFVLG